MDRQVTPTERELDILKVLWGREEATVREVYEELRLRLPLAQNTVQAFLRTMEEKGLVRHRLEGRTFHYQAVARRRQTTQHLVGQLLQKAFDGAIDQLVQSAFSLRRPSADELVRLERLIAEVKAAKSKAAGKKEPA